VSNEDVPAPAAEAPVEKTKEVKKSKDKNKKQTTEEKENAGLDAMMNEEIEDKISKSELKKATPRKGIH